MAAQTNSRRRPATWQARPALETKPPKLLLKVGNFFLKRMRASMMGDVIMLLTFTERKSGKAFTTPLGYTRAGHTVTCFTDSPWQKNLAGGAAVTVTLRGTELVGFATPVVDMEHVLAYVKQHLQNDGPPAGRQMGLSLPKGYLPTDAELRIMLRDRALINIELQGGN